MSSGPDLLSTDHGVGKQARKVEINLAYDIHRGSQNLLEKSVAEFIMQETDQPDMRVYNVRHSLTELAHEDGCMGGENTLGAFGKLLVSIPGVEVVRVQRYRFFVSKAVMFEWSEIEQQIAELVENFKHIADLVERLA